MSEEQEIRDGERVAAFLADEAVAGALKRLADRYVSEWRVAKTVAERETIHAKARALDDFKTQLESVVTNGKFAANTRDRRTPAPPKK